MSNEVQAHGDTNGYETFGYRLRRLEAESDESKKQLKELSDRIDRLTLAIVGFALTLAVFGLGIAITLLSSGAR